MFLSKSWLLFLFVLLGHVGVSGLHRDKLNAGAAHDPQTGANANRFKPTPGAQLQQAQLPTALRGKPRSPSRRHTFNGTATSFGDEFNTAPSDFIAGASAKIGMPSLCLLGLPNLMLGSVFNIAYSIFTAEWEQGADQVSPLGTIPMCRSNVQGCEVRLNMEFNLQMVRKLLSAETWQTLWS